MPFFSISSPTSGNATQLQGRPINATAPATGTVLTFNGSSWGAAQGITGPAGPNGADGARIFWGTTGPATNIGRSGDFYIDGSAGVLYGPKANNAWGGGLLLQSGPTGPSVTGPTGAASVVTGPTGGLTSVVIGTVTTGAAAVTVTGTGASRTLNFVLPFATGPTGASVTGPTGPAGLSVTGPTGAASSVTGPTGIAGSFSDAQAINTQTAGYTLVLSDAGKLLTFDDTTGTLTLTVPANADVSFATGTHVDVARIGDAAVEVVGDTGVTVNATPGHSLRAKYSSATIIKIDTDEWLLVGDLA